MNYEFNNDRPIYLQLVEQIEFAIISGEFAPGERLPSVRDLAIEFQVNPNTMQRALTELENKKLIYTERTNGKFVTTNHLLIDQSRQSYANQLADDFFTKMQELGFDQRTAIKHLKQRR